VIRISRTTTTRLMAALVTAPALVVVSGGAAQAAGCDNPDTTWIGPATQGGSAAWAETANWSDGVPAGTAVVCIPGDVPGPVVPAGTNAAGGVIDADGATVTLNGELTVGNSFDVAALVGDFGELRGGTTRVKDRLAGYWLTLLDGAVVDLRQDATLGGDVAVGGELHVTDGSRLNVKGDAVLEPDTVVDSFSGPGGPGLFTITETGSLTFATESDSADVIGGFANHGEVTVTAGGLMMFGAGPEDALAEEFSTGTFTGGPGADFFNVGYTELRTDARLDHVTWVDHITVPDGNTVTVANSTLVGPDNPNDTAPSFLGAGELVVTDDTVVGARIGESLTVTVPAGETVKIGDAVVQDQANLQVYGELAQRGDVYLEDDAVLDVHGVHRTVDRGGMVDFSGTDPGLEIIHPEGQLLSDQDSLLGIYAPAVNHGTVDSGSGLIVFAPRAEAPEPSSGTFYAGPAGDLYLGDGWASTPELVLDQATTEGTVTVAGRVRSNRLEVRGALETWPAAEGHDGGHLNLAGTTTLADGGSIAGDVTVAGQLEADPGAIGTATLSGAEVTGSVRAVSGTLSIPSLATTTLQADGTLTSGEWSAAAGARLDLPTITTNDAKLTLEGPDAAIGGLTALDNGPNGTLDLRGGADLNLPGRFRNEGLVQLSPGSRLITGAHFRQFSTGTLVTEVAATGRGRVRAEGRRDLAGELVVQRDPEYTPPVDTVLTFLTSNGRVDPDDTFDNVVSPRYGTRKLRVDYGVDKVHLWVDRVG
jgi:hypothetical protein